MANLYLYPGKGEMLRPATGLTGNIHDAAKTVIEPGKCSMAIGAEDCYELSFHLEFSDNVAGQSVTIQKSKDIDFTNPYDYETHTIMAGDVDTWNAGRKLTGFYRVKNDTNKDLVVYVQKGIQ